MNTLPFQQEMRPEFPNIYGTYDYRQFRDILIKIDDILSKSGLEHELVSQALNQHREKRQAHCNEMYNNKPFNHHYKTLKHALRCNIARHLTGESYRLFSIRLADSLLFQWFTSINAFGSPKAISKSSLERYEKCFDETFIGEQIRHWLSGLSDDTTALTAGLMRPIDYQQTFMDSSCVKAPIHYPVDWVLLRDGTRSLLSAIHTIRAQGLKNRMMDPKLILKKMNRLCIEMTHTRRKKASKKNRKAILRAMKKLSHCILKHGKRYRQLLLEEWETTDWTQAQAYGVIRRIDNIIEQLPTAIQQAHDRIIGERQIQSSDKILSLYDKEAEVIVRGKAGNEVEFGQRLLLSEQRDGLIMDWELFAKGAPSDSQLLQPTVERLEKYYGAIGSVSTDRAFTSGLNDQFLQSKNIYNATCPKSPTQLQERLSDPIFSSLQTRRSQTEARIGIFKRVATS